MTIPLLVCVALNVWPAWTQTPAAPEPGPRAAGGPFELLADVPGAATLSAETDLPTAFPVLRSRRVVLGFEIATAPASLGPGDRLRLGLFADATYVAAVDRVTTDAAGVRTIRARLEGFPMGYALITVGPERTLVSVEVPEQRRAFAVVWNPTGQAYDLQERDASPAAYLPGSPVVMPPPPDAAGQVEIQGVQQRLSTGQGANDPAILSVMVVYTPAAREWAETHDGGIANTIAQAMGRAQLAADNSGVLVTFALAHAREVDYTESGSSGTDLVRLRGKVDGALDPVHEWRDGSHADLVVLLTRIEDTGGIAYLLDSTAGRPDYAFCIVRVQQASRTYTLVHELGHNLGCHHHKEQTFQPATGVLFGYSAGWRWVGSDGARYCSIMSYESGSYFADGHTHTRVAHFSNPGISHLDAATGHATEGDNARSLREVKHVVAAYREEPRRPTPPGRLRGLRSTGM